jgi:hypothetical protein
MMRALTSFDYRELDNRLTVANARRECLSCGSDDVDFDEAGYAIIEVPPDRRLKLSAHQANVLYCGLRVCNACGFVHLYNAPPVVVAAD